MLDSVYEVGRDGNVSVRAFESNRLVWNLETGQPKLAIEVGRTIV